MKTLENSLYKMRKASQRESAKADGFYDGRFRTRTVVMQKFKKPKHKSQIIQID